jgi:hypothetical protein
VAIIAKATQRFNAPIQVTPTTHLLNIYDDGGLPLDAVEITDQIGTLVGRISVAIVGGQAEFTIDTDGLAAGIYWYDARASTNGGSSWTTLSGSDIEVYSIDTETINIGAGSTHTLTADLPSAGKTSLIINFASSTSTLDGSASNFKIIEAALLGRVELNGPGICTRLGDSSTDAIDIVASGDGVFICDQIEFDQCGSISYGHYAHNDGYYEFTDNTIKTNSVVPIGAAAGSPDSFYQIQITGPGNQQYPNLLTGNRIGKGWIDLQNASDVQIEDNVMQGLRCGLIAGPTPRWTYKRNYLDCQMSLSTWSQVTALSWTLPPDEWEDNIFRGGQFQVRVLAGGGSVVDSVFADPWAENSIDAPGDAADTIIDRNIFLPLTQTTATNGSGWIAVRGDNVKVRHNTVAINGSTATEMPFVSIYEGEILEEYVDNLVTGLLVTRGPALAGDAAISPADGSGIPQAITGSPLRPGSTPNRITTATNNGWFDNDSADADDYEEYGVGTVTGSPGTDDVTGDPLYVTGTYTFPDDADIWDRTDTVTDMLAAIRAAFTLASGSPMRGAASDDTHIGAVQDDAPGGGRRFLLH